MPPGQEKAYFSTAVVAVHYMGRSVEKNEPLTSLSVQCNLASVQLLYPSEASRQ